MTETALVAAQPKALTMFEMKPQAMIAYASEIANVLKAIIKEQRLFTNMGKKDHVWVEGWTTMGAMVGVVPREEWVKRLDDGSYEAKVELISLATGKVVGGGSALCSIQERNWKGKDEFSIRSMAITRATGKAYRLGFSWIMTLAGYSPTPAEEMPDFQGYTEPQTAAQNLNTQLKAKPVTVVQAQSDIPPPDEPGSFEGEVETRSDRERLGKIKCNFGTKFPGRTIESVPIPEWINYFGWLQSNAKKNGEDGLKGDALELYKNVKAYAESAPSA